MDSRQLDQVEFEFLKGTEIMVNMINNRKHVIGISPDLFNELLEYLDTNTQRLYYVRCEGKKTTIYFESPLDKENTTHLLRHFFNSNN